MRRNPNVPSAHPAAAVARRLTVGFDPLRISLFLLFLFTVSRIHQHFGPLARLRPALLLVMITAGYAFLNPRFLNTQGLFRTWPARVIAGLGVLACLSAAFGISLGGSARFILDDYSKVLVFAFLLIAGIRHTRDLYTFVWAYVLSCGILAYLSLFVFQLKRTNDGMMRLSNLYTFDANDVGLVMVVGLPLALLVYQVAKGKAKLGAGIILVGIGATIARTGSRGAFVGVMVVGLALLVMLKTIPVAKRLMFLGVTVVALAVAAPAGYWEQMKTIFEPTEDYNYT